MSDLKNRLNIILLSLLGSDELVNKWWSSPNKHWDMRTPEEVFEEDTNSVIDYLAGQLNGDYS
jgi:hypothetical protein